MRPAASQQRRRAARGGSQPRGGRPRGDGGGRARADTRASRPARFRCRYEVTRASAHHATSSSAGHRPPYRRRLGPIWRCARDCVGAARAWEGESDANRDRCALLIPPYRGRGGSAAAVTRTAAWCPPRARGRAGRAAVCPSSSHTRQRRTAAGGGTAARPRSAARRGR